MSKPSLPKADKRSERIQLRFTPSEMRYIAKLAKEAGEPYVGPWLSALILAELRSVTKTMGADES